MFTSLIHPSIHAIIIVILQWIQFQNCFDIIEPNRLRHFYNKSWYNSASTRYFVTERYEWPKVPISSIRIHVIHCWWPSYWWLSFWAFDNREAIGVMLMIYLLPLAMMPTGVSISSWRALWCLSLSKQFLAPFYPFGHSFYIVVSIKLRRQPWVSHMWMNWNFFPLQSYLNHQPMVN